MDNREPNGAGDFIYGVRRGLGRWRSATGKDCHVLRILKGLRADPT